MPTNANRLHPRKDVPEFSQDSPSEETSHIDNTAERDATEAKAEVNVSVDANIETDPKTEPNNEAGVKGLKDLWGDELYSHNFVACPKPLLKNWRFVPGLNRTDVLLLLLLLDTMSMDGRLFNIRIKSLATQMGAGERLVRSHIKKLKKHGYIVQSDEKGKARSYDLRPLFKHLVEAQKQYEKTRKLGRMRS